MWDYCGGVKEESTLKKGLNMINDLENKSNNTKSDLNSNNIENLISTLDLKASIFSAKVTIESCLNRKESRGSNQRSDFKEINTKFNQNVLVNFKNDQIHIDLVDLKQKKEYINQIIKNSKLIKNFRGKLLE